MDTNGSNVETRGFQAEVKQLLHLMIHSLYSDREIFLRELISNASDACDKLRFEALSHSDWLADDPELRISVEIDDKQGTLSIRDNGIGMSRDEVIENLGTIAHSGTARFLSQMSGEQRRDAHLIGQFGVGLYSAFMVADSLEILTRRAGEPEDAGVRWVSDGRGEYTVESRTLAERGTAVILHLKENDKEFASSYRVEDLVRRYSDHIAYPVYLQDAAGRKEPRTINSAQALWTRPRQEIGDEEYVEFYKHLSHDMQRPLAWTHRKVEGAREYTSLLFTPAKAPWDLWNRDAVSGLKLYVQRVFILDRAEQFLPMYLRFLRGVVDASDLPLNVSRELLQQDPQVAAMRKGITRQALEMLEKLAEGEDYPAFWKEFGTVLKEGVVEDFANREKIAALLRFESSADPSAHVSLDQYLSRMGEKQNSIYYLVADSPQAARGSPHLEIFRRHGIEVLLLGERIDEWLVAHLQEFRGKPLRDISRDELDLAEVAGQEADPLAQTREAAYRPLLARLKSVLHDRVSDTRVSQRLTDSPACLVLARDDVGPQMRRAMEAAGQAVATGAPILEINPQHPLIKRLERATDDAFADWAQVLLDQATLAEGRTLPDPAAFVRRINKFLAGADAAGPAA